MGAWSTAILGNDTSAETYEYFKRMYKYQEGNKFKWSAEEICDSLLTYNYDTINLPTVKPDIFFAIAFALWEINELNDHVKHSVKKLVEKRIDYNAWKELEADEKTLKKRITATEQFLAKLDTANQKPKARQLSPAKLSAFVLGDCLAFEHKGKYYGVIVANDARNVDDGTNQFALTNIVTDTIPTIEDFFNAELVLNEGFANSLLSVQGSELAYPHVIFMFKLSKSAAEKAKKEFHFIGNLHMPRTHYERTSIRLTDFPGKATSLKKIVIEASEYWQQNPFTPSGYKLSAESKPTPYKQTATHLEFAEHKIPLKNIYLKINNSLWHVNAWLYIKDFDAALLENHWLTFVDIIEKKTGREINEFIILTKDVDITEMKQIQEMEFEQFKMKRIKDEVV